MGGKAKQSQRTKNNVRPSSSGRSAELLGNVVKTDNVFGSLSTGKGLPGLFPTMAAGGVNQIMSNEYTLVFKKFNKKDPITRTKALNELLELIKTGEDEDVVSVLPSWSHFYLTLTIDSDRKVRELTQACHGAIVSRCGRRAGPHVRRLLPAWLLARHDDHAPAQALAAHHLDATFSDQKLSGAITYCRSEIMGLLIDNLTGNAESIINKKIDDPDEQKCQVIRIISSSLRALEMFVSLLAPEHDEWLRDSLEPAFNGGYWKLASHESEMVRASWYIAAGGLVSRLGSRLGQWTARLATACLASERRAHPAATRWSALLTLLTLQDWQVWIKKKDLIIKRLIETIENGGGGSAGLIRDVVLPVLQALPAELLTKDFYRNLFNAYFTGLQLKTIVNSKSERQTWITNLAECLRHLSTQNHDFVIEITSHVQRTWLENIFAIPDDNTRNHLIKVSGHEMAAIDKFWIKQTNDTFDKLSRNFWQNLGVTMVTQIENVSIQEEEISKLIASHSVLLKALKAKVERKKSIRFSDDVTVENKMADVVEYEKNVLETFEHSLKDLVSKVCYSYLECAETKQMARSIFPSLASVVTDFDSVGLFQALATGYNTSSVFGLYDKLLRGWLASDTMRCKALAEIVFTMSQYFTDEELEAMYSSFQHLSPVALEWCISLSLSHARAPRGAGARWLRGEVVGQTLLSLSKRSESQRLVLACLSEGNGELVSQRTVEAIITQVANALDTFTDSQKEAETQKGEELEREESGEGLERLEFAMSLCRALGTSACADLLILALFKLNLRIVAKDSETDEGEEEREVGTSHSGGGAGGVSPGQWGGARGAWHDALCARAPRDRAQPRTRACEEIHAAWADRLDTLDIAFIEHIVSICVYLFDYEDPDVSEIAQVTEQLLNMDTSQSDANVHTYALRKDIIYQKLNCPIDDGDIYMKRVLQIANNNETGDLGNGDVTSFANKLVFRALYLKEIMVLCADQSLMEQEFFKTLFVEVLYDWAVVASLCEGYAFMSFYETLKQTNDYLDSVIRDIIATISEDINNQIINVLAQKSIKHGYYWAYTQVMYEGKTRKLDDEDKGVGKGETSDEVSESVESVDVGSNASLPEIDTLMLDKIVGRNGFFHSLQAKDSSACSSRAKYIAAVRAWYWTIAGGRQGEGEGYTRGGSTKEQDASRARAAALAARASGALAALRLDPVLDDYYQHDDKAFTDRDYSTASWEVVASHSSLLELLHALVVTRGWELSAHEWDFTNIVMCSVLASLAQNFRHGCTKTAAIARPVLLLTSSAVAFSRSIRSECEKRAPSEHVANLPNEWRDIFAPEAFARVLAVAKGVLASANDSPTICHIATIDALIEALKVLNWDQIPGPMKLKEYSLDNLQNIAFEVMKTDTHYCYKYLAYYVLSMVAKPLVLDDVDKLTQLMERREREGDDDEETLSLSLARYYEELRHMQHVVADVQHDRWEEPQVGVAGYLLSALALLAQHALARGDLVHHYINSLGEADIIAPILSLSVRAAPAVVRRAMTQPNVSLSLATRGLFTTDPLFCCTAPAPAALSAAACRTVLLAARQGASAARAHWSSLSSRSAQQLQRLVELAVAPPLLDEQLANLRDHAQDLEDAEVQVVKGAGGEATVVCRALVEERSVELSITLSSAHPLTPPRPAPPGGLSLAAHTHCLRLYLAYQNGWVVNALKMWTEMLRSRVEAAAQCYICYCRLDPAAGKLPQVPCHTCGNRFHAACLRKWFRTSKKSNCPLCRTVF